MGVGLTQARLDALERRFDVVLERYIPFVGLAIGLGLSPALLPGGSPFWLPAIGLTVATAAWCWWFVVRQPPPAERFGAVYLTGLLLLMAALTYITPLFAFLSIAIYPHSYMYLRGRWRFVGIVAGAAIVAYSQMGGRFGEFDELGVGALIGFAVLLLANSALGSTFTLWAAFISTQSERRRATIMRLHETNQRLEESLEENAALHAQLLAQAREAGILDERARLAREIHDTIAQGLTGIVTQLEAAGATPDDPGARHRHLDTAAALARESLTEARRSVDALAPGQLAEAHLPEAIATMAKAWAETAGVELIVDTTGDPRPLLPDIEVTLFRVAQEALANAGKHAAASRVGLTLSYMDDVVALDVRDDGRGFEPGAAQGFGLAAMSQRVRRVSGTLSVESEPGEGTALSASVPAIPAEVMQ